MTPTEASIKPLRLNFCQKVRMMTTLHMRINWAPYHVCVTHFAADLYQTSYLSRSTAILCAIYTHHPNPYVTRVITHKNNFHQTLLFLEIF